MTHEQARQLLETKRQRLEQLREGRNVETPRQPFSTLADYDQAADVGSERLEVEMELSVWSQLETRISDIESALTRLGSGTWGACESCGERIPDERLEFRPESRFCTSHQEEVDRLDRMLLLSSDEEPVRLSF